MGLNSTSPTKSPQETTSDDTGNDSQIATEESGGTTEASSADAVAPKDGQPDNSFGTKLQPNKLAKVIVTAIAVLLIAGAGIWLLSANSFFNDNNPPRIASSAPEAAKTVAARDGQLVFTAQSASEHASLPNNDASRSRYLASNVADHDRRTAWSPETFGAEAVDQTIELNFGKQEVQGLAIAAGYQKDQEHFDRNYRPTTLGIYVDGVYVDSVSVAQEFGEVTSIVFDKPAKASSITLEIEDCTLNKEDEDHNYGLCCISEVYAFGQAS